MITWGHPRYRLMPSLMVKQVPHSGSGSAQRGPSSATKLGRGLATIVTTATILCPKCIAIF